MEGEILRGGNSQRGKFSEGEILRGGNSHRGKFSEGEILRVVTMMLKGVQSNFEKDIQSNYYLKIINYY